MPQYLHPCALEDRPIRGPSGVRVGHGAASGGQPAGAGGLTIITIIIDGS